MKQSMVILSLLVLLFFSPHANAAVNVSFGFRTDDFAFLAGYGSWVTVRNYGTVWRPSVVSTWRPFLYGHWIRTDNDWTWVSYEPYGWAVYHYGYWNYEPTVGWYWIPGNEWSAARVSWVSYGNYVGWAPLPPAGVVLPEPWIAARVRHWNVVPMRSFTVEGINAYVLHTFPVRPAVSITVVRRSPEIRVVERSVNRRIDVIHVSTVNVPAGRLTLRRIEYPAAVTARIAVHRPVVEREVLRVHKSTTVAVHQNGKTAVVHKKTKVKVKKHN